MSDWATFSDGDLIAIDDAFETASMETSLREGALVLWYGLVEEIARRDLVNPDHRADTADWIIGFLVPSPRKVIEIPDPPPYARPLPGVSIRSAD